MPKRIDKLTEKQKSQIDAWADKWIEIGLRTGEIDLQTFTEGTKEAYGFAGIPWHSNVIVVDNPLVMALAAPIAGLILNNIAVRGAVHGAVNGAVRDAVIGAVSNAVDDAVGDAVGGAVVDAVGGAVNGAVGDAVGDAVDNAVRDAVDDAVRGAVDDAVVDAVHGAVHDAVQIG